MAPTRDFSVYLLRDGFDATTCLKTDNGLQAESDAASLPDRATLYIMDGEPHDPWWKKYFEIRRPLMQVSKGAIVFLPVGERVLALCFGHVGHNLLDESYEYDFGLRTTLNCVDPTKLKNTDVAEPGSARRRRTQLTVQCHLA